jgi:hypothetical protein
VDRRGTHRDYATDLVAPPTHRAPGTALLGDLLIDPAAQIRCLAELVDRDLISPEEFDEAKRRVLRPLR